MCAESKGKVISSPLSNLSSRVLIDALHSVNLVPGALRGLVSPLSLLL